MTSNKYIKINNYPQYTALISSAHESTKFIGNSPRCIVDTKYVDTLKRYTWSIDKFGYFHGLHNYIFKISGKTLESGHTIDHINRERLDNREENLRSASYSSQNSNRSRMKRKDAARPLPEGCNFTEDDIPKYAWLKYEQKYDRWNFVIQKHPKFEGKIWQSSKSKKYSLDEKLQATIDKLRELDVMDEDIERVPDFIINNIYKQKEQKEVYTYIPPKHIDFTKDNVTYKSIDNHDDIMIISHKDGIKYAVDSVFFPDLREFVFYPENNQLLASVYPSFQQKYNLTVKKASLARIILFISKQYPPDDKRKYTAYHNMNKFDNRIENLFWGNKTEAELSNDIKRKNINQNLPEDCNINPSTIPRFIQFYKSGTKEYFFINKHPAMEGKKWYSSTSKDRTIDEKYQETLRKYDELELPSCPKFIFNELN